MADELTPPPAGLPALDALAGDAHRDRTVELLSVACADGRLHLQEFSRRVEAALAAQTLPELARLTSDLVVPLPTNGVAVARRRSWVVAMMASTVHRGRWRVAPDTRVVALMGECVLDLRQADVESSDSHILAVAVMGSVRVIVPEGIEVDLDGLALMGTRDLRAEGARPLPGCPRIRVTAAALMGEIQVVVSPAVRPTEEGITPPAPGERWARHPPITGTSITHDSGQGGGQAGHIRPG
ncbi:MAG: DUF1707 domain-containing protein [Candidatus Dormiibacterota bacterium]